MLASGNGKYKTIRFGERERAQRKPKAGESEKKKRNVKASKLVTRKILKKVKCLRLIGPIRRNSFTSLLLSMRLIEIVV